jgi:SAM-dependent methyltransferase
VGRGNKRSTDDDWSIYGDTEPYFGVLTDDQFLRDRMDGEASRQFFASGVADVEWIESILATDLGLSLTGRRLLDFGCGVGRLSFALAATAKHVTGADVSPGMIAEARKNLEERQLDNVTFVELRDGLQHVAGPFDGVVSHIVFQHIPPRAGAALTRELVERLEWNGVGALHFLYEIDLSGAEMFRYRLYRSSKRLWRLRSTLRRVPHRPLIQMHEYDLNTICAILRTAGCRRISVRFTEHDRYRGVLLAFEKAR